MTDLDLLAQKLAFIETCVQELRTLARPAEILHDVREARFVLNDGAFDKLAKDGKVPVEVIQKLRPHAGENRA